ncbi:MAG: SRPBCC domain-containing protein [Candidatus Hydrogenedentes bacterium]|nr:SRPBCC domain-containing protein [Candidatus Hydrogenedentota bacterium]
MSSTRVTQRINAAPANVYQALLDPQAIAKWRFPDGMRCYVHAFDAREGGEFRVSLTYEVPSNAGKTDPLTDTYHGFFRELVPNEKVVEVLAFESDNPSMQGEMVIRTTLADANGGTLLVVVHENLPNGVSAADNETGWRMALTKLAALVEAG